MRCAKVVTVGVLSVLCLSTVCRGASEAEIAGAVRRLGSSTHSERQKAAESLLAFGDAALPALREAAHARDPEVRFRAAELVREIEERASAVPVVPPELEQKLDASDATSRRQVIQNLLGQGTNAYKTVYGLLMSEADEKKRAELVSMLVQANVRPQNLAIGGEWGIKLLGPYLQQGSTPVVSEGTRDFVAWAVITGTASNVIAKLSRQPIDDMSSEVAAQLILLHLAADEFDKVGELRQRCNNASLLTPWILETGSAEYLDKRLDSLAIGPLPAVLAATAVRCRLQNRQEAKQAVIATLESIARMTETSKTRDGQTDHLLVDALLAVDRPRAALEYLRARQNYLRAFEMCTARGRYGDALQMADASKQESGEVPRSLEAIADHFQEFHGTPDLQADMQAFRKGIGVTNALETAQRLIGLCLANGKTQEAIEISRLVTVQLGISAYDAAVALAGDPPLWWYWLREKHSGDTERQRLERLIRFLAEPSVTKDLLPALVWMMRGADAEPEDAKSVRQCWQVGFTCMGLMPEGPTLDIQPFQVWMGSKAGAFVCLAALLEANGDLSGAAEWYRRATENQPFHAAARYLYGKALVRLDREQEGRRYILEGTLLPLASPQARCELIRILLRCGKPLDALEQWDLARRLGCFEATWRPAGFRFAQRLLREEVPKEARKRLLRYTTLYEGEKAYSDISERLQDAAEQRCVLALEAISAGNFDAAVAGYDRAFEMSGLNVDLFADGVNALAGAGRRSAAERLYGKEVALLKDNSRLFPDCSHCHNTLAWFMARCHRDLDDALKHAHEAVRLAPRASAYIDTLAEVLFHQGKRDEALRLQEEAIRYDPNSRELRERLERFRNDPFPTGGW